MINQKITFPKESAYFLEQDISFAQWQQQVLFYRDILLTTTEQTWLLFVEDSYTFSLYFFALIAAEKRIVLPPNGQPEQLKECMKSADVFLGSFVNEADKINVNNFHCFSFDDYDNTTHCRNETLEFSLDSDIVFFTSGSSGQAKAINKSFHQLVMEVELLEETFGNFLDSQDTENYHIDNNVDNNEKQKTLSAIVMATVSHQHIYGLLFKLLWPIWSGRHLHLSAFSYPEHLVQQIKSYQRSKYGQRKIVLISSPAYYHRLLSDNVLVEVKEQFSVLFSSGGPLNAEAAIELKSALTTPIEVFGSTETGGIAWRQRAAQDDDLWQVFSGIKCANDNDEQRLMLLSPYLADSCVSHENWYQTDDRVELIDAQRFKLLGRTDRIVKIEEKRCSLDELGLYLGKHDWVEEAYVLLLTKQGKRNVLAAALVLTATGKLALASQKKFSFDRQLKTHLKQYVEAIVLPRKFRYLESLPYNSQGKLNKKYLEHLFD